MYNDENDEIVSEQETGSDDLLAADDLRLPESANILVRLHALRAWLDRRYAETELEIGVAALDLQEAMRESESRPRRRINQNDSLFQRTQQALVAAQQSLSAYDEARSLLEDCVAHTTTGERLLVEFYLSLEELIEASNDSADPSWLSAMTDVLHRVEQVSTPGGEGE